MDDTRIASRRGAWNKGKLVGQKAPFKLQEIWAIRIRLQMRSRLRELALFDLGIDSKMRACDLVKLRVRDVCHGGRVGAQRSLTARTGPSARAPILPYSGRSNSCPGAPMHPATFLIGDDLACAPAGRCSTAPAPERANE